MQNLIDVSAALKELGHDVIPLNADDHLIENLKKLSGEIDLVFSIADEGFNLDTHLEPHIVALFELLGLPYTGADYRALTLCLDKPLAKRIISSYGLPTPKFREYTAPIKALEKGFDLSFPLIVKPAKEDGSIGIKQDSVVDEKNALIAKINETIARYEQPVLVEEFIEGREVNVAVIGTKDLLTLPPSEIIFTLPEGVRNFLFYETKWVEDSVYYATTTPHCPADLEPALREELETLAKDAYRIMGLRGYGRVDFRIDQQGKPFILEVNPNPDICKDAGLTRMAKAHGWSYEELIARIMDLALGKE